MPSKRESSARVDYVPALCTHRPSLLPIEWSGEVFGSILCCVPKPDGIMDVLPSLLHPVPFGVRGGPQSCLVSRVRPLKSVWPRRCTGARSCFRMRKMFLRVGFMPSSLDAYAFCLLTRTMLVLCYDLFVAHGAC